MIPQQFFCVLSLLLLLCSKDIAAWDSDDLEVFDVVEEVGVNFYTLLQIEQDATPVDIKRAFRRLSLLWHPDKNSAPDAEIKFRQLAAVYDILKDNAKRSKYHQVLEHGLPDWRQAVYYYRRVRKMGLMEMSVILFIIVTIGQYLVAWASYFEKKYAIEEYLTLKSKRLQKKQKKGKIDGSIEIDPEKVSKQVLPRPSVSCTLPVQICKLVWFLIVDFPPLTYHWTRKYFEDRQKRKEQALQEESEEEEEVVIVRERAPRRRKAGFTVPEVSGEQQQALTVEENKNSTANKKNCFENVQPVISGGIWTDDDFADLIRLMKKYPPGTTERWEKIGESMRRPAAEVAHMAHKMKDDGFKPLHKQEEEDTEVILAEPKKVKTKGSKMSEEVEEGVWSQVQQKAFESALAKFPKTSFTSSSDRWDKIARSVPGKSKEECLLRYKLLADRIRKKKEKESTQGEQEETEAS